MRKRRGRSGSSGPPSDRNTTHFEPNLLESLRQQTERRNENLAWRRFQDPAWRFERQVIAALAADVDRQLQQLVPSRHRQTTSSYKAPPGFMLMDPETGEISGQTRAALLQEEPLRERKRTQPYDPCQDSKEQRRAAVLRSGHGGINGIRNYSKHKDC